MQLAIFKRIPTVSEFNELRKLAEWPTLEEEVARVGLSNSLFGVVIENKGAVVGMGRIVGDNAIYLHIQDVIVRPDFQRRGIGTMIMKELLAYAETIGGKNTNIGLMSSKGREPFYESFGFIERPTGKFGAGMSKVRE
jgi:GNAT superfamily N-acetyltransferase